MGQVRMGKLGMQFVPGPMAVMVDRLIQQRLDYSLLELNENGGECVEFISESALAAHGKTAPKLLPGIKYGKGQAFFTRTAQVLGLLAKQSEPPTVAVLFRDADGTHSAPADLWQQKFDSISRGFELVGFAHGVPMVPRPKSEAWLLCGLKNQPYQHCNALEDAPGNDNSPNSLKSQLAALVGYEPGAVEQADWVRSGSIDPTQITMPSFVAFQTTLVSRLNNALTLP